MSVSHRFLLACIALFAIMATSPLASANGLESHVEPTETSIGITIQDDGLEREGTTADVTGLNLDEKGGDEEPIQAGSGIGDVLKTLHPATVHFPIAFFLLAGLLEFLALARKGPEYSATTNILIIAGTIGAWVATLFGWIHTGLWFGGEDSMHWHRWIGSGVALMGLAMLLLLRRKKRSAVRLLLAMVCIALLAQGYWGGELAHGPNHLAGKH